MDREEILSQISAPKVTYNQSKQTCIFGLSSPASNGIRYVGSTDKNLNDCLEGLIHRSRNEKCELTDWIDELKKKGQVPHIFELENTSDQYHFDDPLEFWRNYFKMLGAQLLKDELTNL